MGADRILEDYSPFVGGGGALGPLFHGLLERGDGRPK